ncbi:MAG TPA: metallophosphoesterase family protein [Caulobacteraceae bacterium]|jgi:serine/threonine protein phosphatase 1|nr:metallophosphoesterase family protein [Caulobacteraceae bacterium]
MDAPDLRAAVPASETTSVSASTQGRLVYAVGDVHGRYDLLTAILGAIATDARDQVADEPAMLIFCGDYIDRGPQSAEVVEALTWLGNRPDFEVRLIKGNHEQALLRFLDRPEEADDWIRFGGAETLLSYGVQPPRVQEDRAAFVAARDGLLGNMPPPHLDLLQHLEPMVCVGDYAFVHAGIRPGAPLAEQHEDDLLWIRDAFLDAPGPFEKVIVHGHTWTRGLQVLEHRIGIDTGAYATGILTAARLHHDSLAIFDTSDWIRSQGSADTGGLPVSAMA